MIGQIQVCRLKIDAETARSAILANKAKLIEYGQFCGSYISEVRGRLSRYRSQSLRNGCRDHAHRPLTRRL